MNKGRSYKVFIISVCLMLSVMALLSNHAQKQHREPVKLEDIINKER